MKRETTLWDVQYHESMEETIQSGRRVFAALAPCSVYGMHDHREGMHVFLKRSLVVFSRWKIALPDKKIFLTRTQLV